MTDTHSDAAKPSASSASDSTPDPAPSALDSGPDATQASPSLDRDHHGDDSISASIDRVEERLDQWPGLVPGSITELKRHGRQFLEYLVVAAGDSWSAVDGTMFDRFREGGFIHPSTGRQLSAARGSRSVRGWGALRAVLVARDLDLLASDSDMVLRVDPPVVADPIKELPGCHPDRIQAMVMRYRPRARSEDEAKKLESYLPTMRDWVLSAGPPEAKTATKWMRILANALLWADHTLDTIDEQYVLHRSNIDVFISKAEHRGKNGWRGTSRSALYQISRARLPDQWAEKPVSIRKNETPEPYAPVDEFLFREAALLEGKRSRRERLWLTAALLGAGLSISDAAKLGPSSLVDLDGGRLGIRVDGDPLRIVPVREAYTSLIVEATKLCEEGTLFVPADAEARPYNLFAKIRVEGLGRLIVSRARATWVCAHIQHGTALSDLYAYLGRMSAEYLLQMLQRCDGPDDPLAAANRGLGA